MARPITDYRAFLRAKWNYQPVRGKKLRTRRRHGDHEIIWCPKQKRHVPHQHSEDAAVMDVVSGRR